MRVLGRHECGAYTVLTKRRQSLTVTNLSLPHLKAAPGTALTRLSPLDRTRT